MGGPRPIKRIVIIGAGNVATHLAPALDAECEVCAVWSRTMRSAKTLAKTLKTAKAYDSLDAVPRDADLYLIAVPDDAISEVAQKLPEVDGIVAHTSGSTPLKVLRVHPQRAVFYPLQTFTKGKPLDIKRVPLLIEGNSTETYDTLASIAGRISEKVIKADSKTRARIHLGAVFACNFTTYLWQIAGDLVKRKGLNLSIYAPLMRESLEKTLAIGAKKAITGPASRGDITVIKQHIGQLPPDHQNLYAILSAGIMGLNTEQLIDKMYEQD